MIKQQSGKLEKQISDFETDYNLLQSYEKGEFIPVTKKDFDDIERIKNQNTPEKLIQARKSKEIIELADKFIKTKDSGLLETMGSKIDNEFITLGISSIARDFDMVGIARKIE